MELGELWCSRVVKLRFSSARSGWRTSEVLIGSCRVRSCGW